ncbi:MAG TPA: formate--tetrahydrofolate ligase, partial [Myxococcota bacterium]|nr:formate--tetrahydrofolate ligase [Myxococcota bacterium]
RPRGAGCEALAEAVVGAAGTGGEAVSLHAPGDGPVDRMRNVVQRVYGGRDVALAKAARSDLSRLARQGLDGLPVCMAKVPGSLTDDAKRVGAPVGFDVTVQRVIPQAGAGFLVALTGETVRMPGLGAHPQAERVDVVDGQVVGIG